MLLLTRNLSFKERTDQYIHHMLYFTLRQTIEPLHWHQVRGKANDDLYQKCEFPLI